MNAGRERSVFQAVEAGVKNALSNEKDLCKLNFQKLTLPSASPPQLQSEGGVKGLPVVLVARTSLCPPQPGSTRHMHACVGGSGCHCADLKVPVNAKCLYKPPQRRSSRLVSPAGAAVPFKKTAPGLLQRLCHVCQSLSGLLSCGPQALSPAPPNTPTPQASPHWLLGNLGPGLGAGFQNCWRH